MQFASRIANANLPDDLFNGFVSLFLVKTDAVDLHRVAETFRFAEEYPFDCSCIPRGKPEKHSKTQPYAAKPIQKSRIDEHSF